MLHVCNTDVAVLGEREQTEWMTSPMPTALFDAVNTVVDEHGWSGATAEFLAKAAGVNRTTLHRNGYTRQRLLADAAAEMGSRFKAATLGALTAPGSAHERMVALLDALYDLADEHLGLLAGLYDGTTALFHLGLDDTDTAVLTRLEYTEPIARLLADGRADGTLHSDDEQRDAELIFNMAGWSYVHMRRSHRWEADHARKAITQHVLCSFRSPRKTNPATP